MVCRPQLLYWGRRCSGLRGDIFKFTTRGKFSPNHDIGATEKIALAGDANEICERVDSHLSHDLCAVQLDILFAGAEVEGDLLVICPAATCFMLSFYTPIIVSKCRI